MAEPIALAALALDAGIGWPGWLYQRVGHPVGGFAWQIGRCEARWNRPESGEARRRVLGVATLVLLVAGAGGIGWALQMLALRWGGWPAVALLAFPGLAQRSLFDHVRPVARALDAGDLPAARIAVGMIVGRDTASLDEGGIARAAIESLAESACDGVAAPLFWLIVGGLPGLWIYKGVNTADSLIGHYEMRWRAFGWAAARTDDLMNLLPARIIGGVLCLAGGGGFTTMLRDAGKHGSPNAGWPEAAMAGALGLRLGGPLAYDGVEQAKPWIGEGRAHATADDIGRALRVYVRACALLWLIAGIVA